MTLDIIRDLRGRLVSSPSYIVAILTWLTTTFWNQPPHFPYSHQHGFPIASDHDFL